MQGEIGKNIAAIYIYNASITCRRKFVSGLHVGRVIERHGDADALYISRYPKYSLNMRKAVEDIRFSRVFHIIIRGFMTRNYVR